jgi:hypothetical protein
MATVEVATGDPAVGLQQLRASSSTAEQSVRKSMHKTVPSWIDRLHLAQERLGAEEAQRILGTGTPALIEEGIVWALAATSEDL